MKLITIFEVFGEHRVEVNDIALLATMFQLSKDIVDNRPHHRLGERIVEIVHYRTIWGLVSDCIRVNRFNVKALLLGTTIGFRILNRSFMQVAIEFDANYFGEREVRCREQRVKWTPILGPRLKIENRVFSGKLLR